MAYLLLKVLNIFLLCRFPARRPRTGRPRAARVVERVVWVGGGGRRGRGGVGREGSDGPGGVPCRGTEGGRESGGGGLACPQLGDLPSI